MSREPASQSRASACNRLASPYDYSFLTDIGTTWGNAIYAEIRVTLLYEQSRPYRSVKDFLKRLSRWEFLQQVATACTPSGKLRGSHAAPLGLCLLPRHPLVPRAESIRSAGITSRRSSNSQDDFTAMECFGVTALRIALHSAQPHQSEKSTLLEPPLGLLRLKYIHEITNFLFEDAVRKRNIKVGLA